MHHEVLEHVLRSRGKVEKVPGHGMKAHSTRVEQERMRKELGLFALLELGIAIPVPRAEAHSMRADLVVKIPLDGFRVHSGRLYEWRQVEHVF